MFAGTSLTLAVGAHGMKNDCPAGDVVGHQIKEGLNNLGLQIVRKSGLRYRDAVGKLSFPFVAKDQRVILRQTDYKCEYLIKGHVFLTIRRY